METTLNKKRKFSSLSTITVLSLIILLVAILTYIVPAGEFDRVVNEAGKTVVVPGSYHAIESSPVGFKTLMAVVYNAVIAASSLIGFVFVVGGAFGIINRTGACAAGTVSTGQSRPAAAESLPAIAYACVLRRPFPSRSYRTSDRTCSRICGTFQPS